MRLKRARRRGACVDEVVLALPVAVISMMRDGRYCGKPEDRGGDGEDEKDLPGGRPHHHTGSRCEYIGTALLSL